MKNRKKIVITGASGFLGSHLTERWKDDARCRVFALSSRPDELRERIGGTAVEYLHRDAVFDGREMLEGAVVVNCAYPRNSTGTAVADGLKYIQRVFESAVEDKALAIINISSQSVYSQLRTDTAAEDTPVCLESPYAVGKYAVELMLESICRGSRTAYVNLRLASLIGPGFNQRIVNRFAAKILRREPVTVVRQDKRMGFLDVEDAVSAILAVAEHVTDIRQTVYNVGNGQGYTAEAIYNAVAESLKGRTEVLEPMIENGTETSSTAVSFEKLHADTGFVPAVDLRTSIKRIVDQM